MRMLMVHGIPWDPSAPFWYNVGATKILGRDTIFFWGTWSI